MCGDAAVISSEKGRKCEFPLDTLHEHGNTDKEAQHDLCAHQSINCYNVGKIFKSLQQLKHIMFTHFDKNDEVCLLPLSPVLWATLLFMWQVWDADISIKWLHEMFGDFKEHAETAATFLTAQKNESKP